MAAAGVARMSSDQQPRHQQQQELIVGFVGAEKCNAKVWQCSAPLVQRLLSQHWLLAFASVAVALAVLHCRASWTAAFCALLPQLCWSLGGLGLFLIFVFPAFLADVAPSGGRREDADSAAPAQTGAMPGTAEASCSAPATATRAAREGGSGRDARGLRATAAAIRKCAGDDDAPGLTPDGSILDAVAAAVQKPLGHATGADCAAADVARSDSAAADAASTEGKQTRRRHSGSEVFLNIYDVSYDDKIHRLNSLLSHRLSPLKLGGIFHAGVEVNGREWSFGNCGLGSGVAAHEPQRHPHHNFRESVRMSCTQLSAEQVARVIEDLKGDYQGSSYSLIGRNCCHFADDMCCRLGVGSIPPWVHRFCRLAESIVSWSEAFEDLLLWTGDDESCMEALRSEHGKTSSI
mmetsp:Transcript_47523/g.87116  ORF Transcript_47523/g.87116 Transcript_47523/m.87116 type:complete len:406 (+) Transcript_47523:102-1319(+)